MTNVTGEGVQRSGTEAILNIRTANDINIYNNQFIVSTTSNSKN